MLIVPASESEFFPMQEDLSMRGRYLRLEPLTLCPIDKRPIDQSMLSDDERQWLNSYHRMVFDSLSPLLTIEEQAWLRDATSEI
jgi:Xaa-Pro aminopeptidase